MPPAPDFETIAPTPSFDGGTGVATGAFTCGGSDGGSGALPPGFRGSQPATIPAGVKTSAAVVPPISGGTLLILANGSTAVATDPDRDQVYIVDLVGSKVRATIPLTPGDEPGRVIEDGAGRVHVALRRGGALVTLDPQSGTVTARREVCSAPRGLDFQASTNLVHVACTGGELVSLPAAGGAATRTLVLDQDLRDVVVGGDGRLFVSTFRKAEVLVVGTDGKIAERLRPAKGLVPSIAGLPQMQSPAVAWRMISAGAAGGSGVVVLHQMGVDDEINPANGGYGGLKGCSGVVGSAVTQLTPSTATTTAPSRPSGSLGQVTLAVDVAISPDGSQVAVAAAGNAGTSSAPSLVYGLPANVIGAPGPCQFMDSPQNHDMTPPTGQVVAVAYAAIGSTNVLFAQTREPATLWRSDTGKGVPLATDLHEDTGHMLFHLNPGAGLACASCHPEGGEDGRVWDFACQGSRRTQSIRGGISQTAPFHWDGSEMDFSRLMDDVFVNRMGGPTLAADQKQALATWIDTIPALPAVKGLDAGAVGRGKAIFEDPKVACATCHVGALLTNNATVDVGTGLALQVPSLRGVAWRAPYLHTGCASDLGGRFVASCGGGDQHGVTAALTPTQLTDLVTYLKSL